MRTTARETVFKIVFASQFCEAEKHFIKAMYVADKLNEDDIEYCNKVLETIDAHKAEFIEILDGHSKLFPESGLFNADRSILLIALAEMFYFDDIPSAVSINEAANIASKYSSAKSASFVSGLLSEILREKQNV